MQEEIRLTSYTVNKWLHHDGFKYSWPVYGAHIVEAVMKKHALIPKNYMYKGFDPNDECLVFSIPLSADVIVPTKIDKIKDWIRRKLS